MHFTRQQGFITDVPFIYHPHDLQHVHLPEFFSMRERKRRDVWYHHLSWRAETVVVTSTWARDDIVRHFRLPSSKVVVIPWAPPLEAYQPPTDDDVELLRRDLGIPTTFILYPAQTWPHKNHLNLVRALAQLRGEGLDVPLVLTGRETPFAERIRREAAAKSITDLIHWRGFVGGLELGALYKLARAVVIPSRFEAASAPLWEAFAAGVPAACSNVTSLPKQAGDAALIFDPDDVGGIAAAIRALWLDDGLREKLVENGHRQVGVFSWDRTARTFRALYRKVAGRELDEEDRNLLAAPPLL
jgi:glycosyltransferase involved in cell wall biosynthesis